MIIALIVLAVIFLGLVGFAIWYSEPSHDVSLSPPLSSTPPVMLPGRTRPIKTPVVQNNYDAYSHQAHWQGCYPGSDYGYYPSLGWGYYGFDNLFVAGMLLESLTDNSVPSAVPVDTTQDCTPSVDTVDSQDTTGGDANTSLPDPVDTSSPSCEPSYSDTSSSSDSSSNYDSSSSIDSGSSSSDSGGF